MLPSDVERSTFDGTDGWMIEAWFFMEIVNQFKFVVGACTAGNMTIQF